jgi:hypothetical protein
MGKLGRLLGLRRCRSWTLCFLLAVGGCSADRPPHRSVRARLRIRLLPWMSSGEARIRIRMQSAGLGNPPGQDWGETSPSHLCALAATDKDAPPQPANATLKRCATASSSLEQHGIGSSPAQPCEAMHRPRSYDDACGVEARL